MSLKQKTISGLSWSFMDSFVNQGLTFVVGIILARLLSPEEFGLVGMLTIFMAISQSFIDSGFGQSLIRKKECSPQDYSTVFYFNITTGVLFFLILFNCAGTISEFFAKPELKVLAQVMSLNLIINSIGLIQKTILIRNIDFKLQAKISVISSVTSGVVAVILAFQGYGVWSLVWKTLVQSLCVSILLWLWNKWKPKLIFSGASLRELFGFGSRMMVSGLIDTIYRNVYYLIIGKYFSAKELGFYTRAANFSMQPSQILTQVIQRVSYPVLATLQEDPVKLKAAYKKLIKNTMFISFSSMAGLAAVAGPLVVTLVGEKWAPSVVYLQLLCFVDMLYPLHALNLNMLMVKGRSDLFLRLEILKKILVIPTIILGIFYGIKIMIIGMILNSIISYFLNSYWSGKLIQYPSYEQIADISAPFAIALLMGLSVYILGDHLSFKPVIVLAVQILTGGAVFLLISKIANIDAYNEIKQIIGEKIFKNKFRGATNEAA